MAVNARFKVLLLTHLYLPSVGGVQRSVGNLADALVAHGHAVSIAAHAPTRFGFPARPRGTPPFLGLNVPSPFGFNPLENIRICVLDALNMRALKELSREKRFDLIHCHLINADTHYAIKLAESTGSKIVVTLRGGETELWLKASTRRLPYVKNILARADYVTGVAASLIEQACTLVPEVAGKSRVIRNPLVLSPEQVDEKDAPWPRPYMLFVGRLEEMKDAMTLVDAFEATRSDEAEGLDLLILGDGSQRASLEERVAQGRKTRQVHFIGEQSHGRALRLIRDAALLALPSRHSEGCPNVVMEAMAMNTPVVVSDLPASKEIVADGRGGGVFARGNAADLAEKIDAIVSDPELLGGYVSAARLLIEERHNMSSVLNSYLEVYRDLIKAS
jgi:glycosyltransferase involved in cell wall biosynthesis